MSFIKQGALSPRKIKPQSPFKVEKKSFLSPRRLEAIDALVSSEIKSPVVKKLPFKTPEKASPADVKKRLHQVWKFAGSNSIPRHCQIILRKVLRLVISGQAPVNSYFENSC